MRRWSSASAMGRSTGISPCRAPFSRSSSPPPRRAPTSRTAFGTPSPIHRSSKRRPGPDSILSGRLAVRTSDSTRPTGEHGHITEPDKVVLGAVLVGGSIARTQSNAAWIGTWKVNLDKSTYNPGPKPTVALTVKVEPSAAGVNITADGRNAEGQPTHVEIVGTSDGKDNPVKGLPTSNLTNSVKRIDDRTVLVVGKIDNKPEVTSRAVVSADGKTMTITQTGQNAKGQSVKNVIVADKQ